MQTNKIWNILCATLFISFTLLLNIAHATSDYKITGPFTNQNLAIYLIHGKNTLKTVPLTLQEALQKKLIKVHETGNVNKLSIENLGQEQIFIQSGELVKGGKQDRVLTTSMLLSPKSGQVPIDAFCVEQNRWSKRGGESVSGFASSNYAIPSKEAKLAMKAPVAKAQNSGNTNSISRHARSRGGEDRQSKVWQHVGKIQGKLSRNLELSVTKNKSPSSLQLSLENKKLKKVQKSYTQKLLPVIEKGDDVIGYAFAINGELNSADIYPSNSLFKKLWPKLLKASIIEAIGEKNEKSSAKAPKTDAVLAFLKKAQTGKETNKKLNKDIVLETRDGEDAVVFETQYKKGQWVHRNYIAK